MPHVTLTTDMIGVDWFWLTEILRADEFDNGRTPEQLRLSFENSHVSCLALLGDDVVGTARALSDGVGNAYVVDVWTRSDRRRRGVARRMMRRLHDELDGQHVYLFTGNPTFYESLGYRRQGIGLATVVGRYLHNSTRR